MGKKGRADNDSYLVEELRMNPEIAEKIDVNKDGWKKHAKKLLAEKHNSKVDFTKPASLSPKDFKKFIKKITKEAVEKRIVEIANKQDAEKANQEIVNTPANNVVDVVAEKTE
jgi:hypothetical protein